MISDLSSATAASTILLTDSWSACSAAKSYLRFVSSVFQLPSAFAFSFQASHDGALK
jgi:hypothetical protein